MKISKITLLILPLLMAGCATQPVSSSQRDSSVASSSIISAPSKKTSSTSDQKSSASSDFKSSESKISSSSLSNSKISSDSSLGSSLLSSLSSSSSSSSKVSSSKISSSNSSSSIAPSSSKSSSSSNLSSSSKPSSSSSSSSSSLSSSGKPSSSSSSSSSSIDPGKTDYGTDWYNNYYDGALTWDNSEDLINKLHLIIRDGFNPLYYNSSSKTNWETNQFADQALDDFECVDAVYTNSSIRKDNTGNTGLNREHAFCASLMTGMSTSDAVKYLGRATDYHNLFAAEYEGNTSRSNKCFGVAGMDGTKVTTIKDSNNNTKYSYSTKCFEPSDYDKGRLSRAIFYMAVMYNFEETYYNSDKSKNVTWPAVSIVEGNVDYDSKNPTYSIGYKSTLLKWATSYEVDRLEYQHNESVYSHIYSGQKLAQSNRNPFVDYPELIEYAFGSKTNESGQLKYLKPSAYALNVNSDDFSNYAITQAPRVYSNYEEFNYSDLSFASVLNNYSYNSYTGQFTCSVQDGTKMDSLGDKEITINIDNQAIKYNVHVVNGALDKCSYKGSFVGAEKSLKTNPNEITLNDVKWNITYGNKVSSFSANNILYDSGVQVGTGSANAGTFTLESDLSFNNIDRIYCKANTASKKTYAVAIYVNDELVLTSTNFSYNMFEYNVVGLKLPSTISGKVKFVFSDISAAFYISSIAVNEIS